MARGVAGIYGDTMKAGAGAAPLCVVDSARVARAKAAQNPAKKNWQDAGEANERVIAKMVRGRALDDNEPMDIVVKISGRNHGIEAKTMVDNKSSKITMSKDALKNKIRWRRENKGILHTVVIDDRDKFAKKLYSGHKVYYRKGVGSFRLESMTEVRDAKHLRQLLMGIK